MLEDAKSTLHAEIAIAGWTHIIYEVQYTQVIGAIHPHPVDGGILSDVQQDRTVEEGHT